jgi:hypothetical protein
MSVWQDWSGGPCPVPNGTIVDVKFRDGEVHLNQVAHGLPRKLNHGGSKAWRSYWERNDIPK